MNARQLEDILDRFARAGGIAPVRPFFYIWCEFRVEHEGTVLCSDEAHEYCEGCADVLLTKVLPLLAPSERAQHRVSPTELHSEDTCKHCMICGALLDHALNEYGVASERDHYESLPPAETLHPVDAFHIARMLEAAPSDPAVLCPAQEAIRRLPVTHPDLRRGHRSPSSRTA